jgi:hypothetical protein
VRCRLHLRRVSLSTRRYRETSSGVNSRPSGTPRSSTCPPARPIVCVMTQSLTLVTESCQLACSTMHRYAYVTVSMECATQSQAVGSRAAQGRFDMAALDRNADTPECEDKWWSWI